MDKWRDFQMERILIQWSEHEYGIGVTIPICNSNSTKKESSIN